MTAAAMPPTLPSQTWPTPLWIRLATVSVLILAAVLLPLTVLLPESDEAADLWSKTPIQARGRVKPLYTWARYALLRTNHKLSCETPSGRDLGPVDWMLDVLFRPEQAREYRCFLIETDEILTAMGVDVQGRKARDRYSYTEIEPGRKRLFALARKYERKKESRRSPVEDGIVALAYDVREFEDLLHYLDFAREDVDLSSTPELAARFGGKERVTFSEVMAEAPDLVREARDTDEEATGGNEGLRLAYRAGSLAKRSHKLAILPPTRVQAERLRALHAQGLVLEENPEKWLTPFDVASRAVRSPEPGVAPAHVEMLALLEAMVAHRDDPQAFEQLERRFHARSRELATTLDENEGIELEVAYYRLDLFGWARIIFLIAFLLVAITWLRPDRRLQHGVWLATAVGAAYVVTGIVIRCILRERPPVTSTYETILFITAFMVIVGLVVESMNRRGIALALTPILGAVGLYFAGRYEMIAKQDTMPQLPAVLDTNFWLATHVTCISIGYAASVLTGVVAHVYVLGKVFGLKRNDADFYRTLNRTIYGMLAFALIFTTLGTILGGIWANESWGRFWGWDPKENGALMIALWQLAIIHARLGGYVKAFGLAMASVALLVIVAFCWWGVDPFGVGLHSYGSSRGVLTTLKAFYAVEAAVLLMGAVWWIANRRHTSARGTDRTSAS